MKRAVFFMWALGALQAFGAWTGPTFEHGPLLKTLVSNFNNNRVLEFARNGTLLGEFGDTGSRVASSKLMIRDSQERLSNASVSDSARRFRGDDAESKARGCQFI